MLKKLRKIKSKVTNRYPGFFSPDSREFMKKNAAFWKKLGAFEVIGNRVVISEQAIGGNFWSLVVSTSAALLAAGFKAKVIFLVKGKARDASSNFFQKSFCRHSFFYMPDVFSRKESMIKTEASRIYGNLQSTRDILDIQYKAIPIGEQVYDAVIKYKHATLWKLNETVLLEIENAITCAEAILEIFDSHEVVAGMFTHTTCSYHGVAVRTILSRKKPVYQGFGGLNALYRYNHMLDELGHLDIHIKIPVKHFQNLMTTNRDNLLAGADLYYAKRFGGEINDWDALRAFSPDKKLYRSRKEFFADFTGLNPENKNVFVMLHAMNDDPHVQVQKMFKDYYEWFATTLKIAKENSSVNWIFKQHPMIKFYPDDANLLGLFELIDDVSNIVYIDEDVPFNQASVPNVADVIITCAGTAGLEFSAFGIPAIIAARNSYSGYGICNEPGTNEEYRDLLLNIDKIGPIGPEKREQAKILFYLIYNKLLPSFQTGFFPYMNNDQMRALGEKEARKLYLKGVSHNANVDVRELFDFIVSPGSGQETDLFLNIS